MRPIIFFPLIASLVLHLPRLLLADGGTVRLAEHRGNYQITVLTSPTPLRAGPIDVSVLVQKAGSNELVLNGQVAIQAIPRNHAGRTISQLATTEVATNKLFRAANFELPDSGWWEMEVSIEGPLGDAHIYFEMEAAERLPKWLAMWPWFSWPGLAIVLFGASQLLVKTKNGHRLTRKSLNR